MTWIDVLVEYWHTHNTGNSSKEFLGVSDTDFEKFVKSGTKLMIAAKDV